MPTTNYRAIQRALRELGLTPDNDIIAHVSLEALGDVQGGADAVVGALLASSGTLVMPAFTFQTMVWPEAGPPENGCAYGDHSEENERAVLFECGLPADPSLGAVAEAFRRTRRTIRSDHPVLSFSAAGKHAAEVVGAQSVENPLGPVEWLYHHDGDVVLLGMDQKANFSIHLGEQLAGRKQFIRWAVGPERAYRLPNFPGCSDGFNAITDRLAWIVRQTSVGGTTLQRIPLKDLVEVVVQAIQEDPLALLCDDPACLRCGAVRQDAKRDIGRRSQPNAPLAQT